MIIEEDEPDIETISEEEGKDNPSIKKETTSHKERAMVEIRRRLKVDGKGRVSPITYRFTYGDQVWRPFDPYVKERWSTQASRLSAPRVEPIVTPFGKKIPWSEVISQANKFVSMMKDPNCRAWEERELEDYGKDDFSRHSYDPIMYLGRQLLYDPSWYQYGPEPEWSIKVPDFQPLKRVHDVDLSPDARSANVGFPWLTRMSEHGVEYRTSDMYLTVIEESNKWTSEVLQLPKLTPTTVCGISPPIAVFERAQSGGRPVQAVSKKVALPQMRFTQPLIEASEGTVVGYAGGDRSRLLEQFQLLVSGDWKVIAKGDDLAILLKDGTVLGIDASAFDAAVRSTENINHIEDVASHLSEDDAKVWRATCYAENAELVNCVGMVKKLENHGVTSGSGRTSHLGTFVSLNRATSASSIRGDWKRTLQHMNKFGPYRVEFMGKGFVILLKLYYSEKNPEVICGSVVRTMGAFWQREDPVIAQRKVNFMRDEELRLWSLVANLRGHEMFESVAAWLKARWQFREVRVNDIADAEFKMSKRRDVGAHTTTGEYERESLKAAADLLGIA